MIKKKICMLGSFAVGKTSLVQQYVNSIFSEQYHTSIGVKIDQKIVEVDKQAIHLLLWDIHGEDEFQKIPYSYLKGSSGNLFVLDGTRRSTISIIKKLKAMTDEMNGTDTPFIVLINKMDLQNQWEINQSDLQQFSEWKWPVIYTSAKTGEGVEEAFMQLTNRMIK